MGYTTRVPAEYAEFQLCREMGWSYLQLERTPAHRVQEALEFLRVEGRHRRFESGDGKMGR